MAGGSSSTRAAAGPLVLDKIPQLRRPGRQTPYVTIVDTGLLAAAQRMLAGLYLAKIEPAGEGPELAVDEAYLLDLANRLAGELEARTF